MKLTTITAILSSKYFAIAPTQKRIALLLGIAFCWWGSAEGARSQITPDGTLPTPTLVNGSSINPCNTGTCNITGGTPSGNTLFHSFSQFSIPTGGDANFFNDNGSIQNIIGRITGTFPSQIDGKIQASGSAPNFNLFLINPNGIIFGSDTSLRLKGSFFATTAESIHFDNQTSFGIHDSSPPILTVNVPIGLQFGSQSGEIRVKGAGVFSPSLSVLKGNTIALVGSGIEMQGGTAVATEGRIELGSVAPNSFIKIAPSPTGFALDYSNVLSYRDIHLYQRAGGYANAGQIQVRGRRISLEGGAALTSNPTFTLPGGNINVYGDESVEISGTSGAPLFINSGLYAQNQGSSTNAGNIIVTTPYLNVRDGGIIINSTSGTGNAGDITIDSDLVELQGLAPSTAYVTFTGLRSASTDPMPGAGNGGNITLNTRGLIAMDGAGITAFTESSGNAGNIDIVNADFVFLEGGSSLQARATGSGNAGEIDIDANIVWLENGASLSATNQTTAGQKIRLHDLQLLNLSNSSELSVSTVDGRGGSIEIEAYRIDLDSNSRILSSARRYRFNGGMGNVR